MGHNGGVPTGPAAEYRARLDARTAAHARLAARDTRLADLRLATFGFGVLVGALAWYDIGSYWLLGVPFVAFIALVRHHDVVVRAREEAARAMAFYERGLLRIEDRWQGSGEPG